MKFKKRHVIEAGQAQDRRRSSRRPIESGSMLRVSATMGGVIVEVSDLSHYGCGIESAFKLSLGEEVQLGLDGAGSVRGRIASARGSHYGVEFLAPLATSEMARAFTGAQILTLHSVDSYELPEPEIAEFKPATKLGILITASAVTWGVLLMSMAVALG